MVASVPQIRSTLNLFLTAVLICFIVVPKYLVSATFRRNHKLRLHVDCALLSEDGTEHIR
jgi:hypothetical protein